MAAFRICPFIASLYKRGRGLRGFAAAFRIFSLYSATSKEGDGGVLADFRIFAFYIAMV